MVKAKITINRYCEISPRRKMNQTDFSVVKESIGESNDLMREGR